MGLRLEFRAVHLLLQGELLHVLFQLEVLDLVTFQLNMQVLDLLVVRETLEQEHELVGVYPALLELKEHRADAELAEQVIDLAYLVEVELFLDPDLRNEELHFDVLQAVLLLFILIFLVVDLIFLEFNVLLEDVLLALDE